MDIYVVGAIGGCPVSEVAIRDVLAHPVEINTGNGFIGRPGTRLCVSEAYVAKIKNDFSMAEREAKDWCRLQLEKECGFGIYHSSRTWFCFSNGSGYATANITSRLPVLSQVLSTAEGEDYCDLLIQLVDFYFSFYRRCGRRQDEGLTNYGVDEGRLCYLDDDLYEVDSGLSFAVSLAGYFRAIPGVGVDAARRLGEALRAQMMLLGRNSPDTFARNFRDTFLSQEKEPLRAALLGALLPEPVVGAQRQDGLVPMAGRVAVLADIHANLRALTAVLADMAKLGLEQAIVLGDVVGYGPDPAACVEMLEQRGFQIIRGNHDEAAGTGKIMAGSSRAAAWSIPWTREQLSDSQREWLSDLPLYLRSDDFLAVHGAPVDPTFMNAYVYAMTSDANLDYLQKQRIRLCFHGHTHVPGCWYRDQGGVTRFSKDRSQLHSSASTLLVCPGSVGQSRDGSDAASYLVYDGAIRSFEWRQINYDIDGLRRDMSDLGFPEFVQRLYASVAD